MDPLDLPPDLAEVERRLAERGRPEPAAGSRRRVLSVLRRERPARRLACPLAALTATVFVALDVALGLMCLGSAGCSHKPDVITPETANLRKVGQAYMAATERMGRPPRNMDELTPSLQQLGDPQELLRSRSGEPYEIVWDRDPHAWSKKDSYLFILAYEKSAVGGTHYVVTSMGAAPLSDEELSRHLREQKP